MINCQALLRILFSIALAGSALMAPKAMASGCDIYGGTSYKGCVVPDIKWKDGYGNLLDSKMDAAWSNYGHYMAERPTSNYTGGVKTSSIAWGNWGNFCVWQNYTDNAYMNTDPNYVSGGSIDNLYMSVPVFGFKSSTDSCGNYNRYYSGVTEFSIAPTPVCPEGFTFESHSGNSRTAPFGWACRPAISEVSNNRPCTNCDVDAPGAAEFGNPINMGSKQKRDYALDLKTGGPFPIVWDRTYAAEGYRGWKFKNYLRAVYAEGTTTDYLTFMRRDGSSLEFKAPHITSGAHAWVSDMGAGFDTNLRSYPTDNLDVGGVRQGYILNLRDGGKEYYSLSGNLTSVVNSYGLVHDYSYDSMGRLDRIEDDFGHYLEFSYVANDGRANYSVSWSNNPNTGTGGGTSNLSLIPGGPGAYFDSKYTIRSVTDGDRTVNYSYTQKTSMGGSSTPYMFLLTQVQHADGNTITYVYGEQPDGSIGPYSYYMTGIVDETGARHSSYSYSISSYGMVAKEWKHTGTPGGQTEVYELTGGGVKDPLGNQLIFSSTGSFGQIKSLSYDCSPWCRGDLIAKSITYTNGYPTSITDFNSKVEKRTYNARGLIESRTEAFGTPLARTTTYTWDSTRPLMLTMVEPTKVGGAAHTRTTTWTYNSGWQPLTQTVSSSSGETARVTTYTYNSLGLLETVTDLLGAVTKLTYHTSGNVATITEAFGTALARTTTFGGYTVSGKAGWVTDAAGLTVRTTWDAMDRPTKIEQGVAGGSGPGGSGGTWETTDLTYTPFGKLASFTRPDGLKMEFSYNVAHRLIQVRQKSAGGTLLAQIDYTLDAAGKVTQEVASSGGIPFATASKTYDTLQRLDTEIGALSQVTDYGFDAEGNPTSVKDPLNHTRSQQFDALNRTVKEVDALLGESNLAYDPQDNLVLATDARSVATGYTYNAFNEMLSAVSQDRGTWSYTYDANGNPVTVSDPRGVVATATYDALNRPTAVTWDSTGVSGSPAGWVAGARAITYTWDSCQVGKLCAKSDHSGATAYTYDLWGRLTGQGFTPTGQTSALATGYGYDAYGRRNAVVYPSGKALTIAYGADGRISSQSWAGVAQMTDIAWQPLDGPVTGWGWAASGIPSTKAQVSYTYDLDGRMSHISDIDDIDLVHDNANRLTATDYLSVPAKSQVYGYDNNDRLTTADTSLWPAAMGYTYDAAGNRSQKTWNGDAWSYAYGVSNNRLTSVTPAPGGVPGSPLARTYDAMGNTVTDGYGKSYGFDAQGRMVTASAGGSSLTFVVGSDGLRTRKTVTGTGASGALYAYDDQRRLIGVYEPDGSGGFTVNEELVYLGGEWRLAGTVRGQVVGGADGAFYPVLSDQIGAPRVVLDPSSGDARWEWEAKEAFGHQDPNETPSSAGAFRFDARFPGQWSDPETGLFYNGFRDYDPRTGRYVESDPIGLGGGWNTYAYVANAPLLGTDVFGLVKDNFHPTGNTVKKCIGGSCAVLQPGYLETDSGAGFLAYKFVSGHKGFAQNCHGYALRLPYWVEAPEIPYKEEYIEAGYFDAEITYYEKNGKPKHSSINNWPFNFGKIGTNTPTDYDFQVFHLNSSNTTYLKKPKP